MTIRVHSPKSTKRYRRIYGCPVCKRKTRHLIRFYEYYEATIRCCKCAGEWTGRHLVYRPRKGSSAARQESMALYAEWRSIA